MCIIEFSFCCTDVSDVLSLGCRSVGDFKTKQNIVGRLWDFFFLMEDIFSGRGTTVVLWLENKNSSNIVSCICEQITIIPAHLQVMKILNIIV